MRFGQTLLVVILPITLALPLGVRDETPQQLQDRIRLEAGAKPAGDSSAPATGGPLQNIPVVGGLLGGGAGGLVGSLPVVGPILSGGLPFKRDEIKERQLDILGNLPIVGPIVGGLNPVQLLTGGLLGGIGAKVKRALDFWH